VNDTAAPILTPDQRLRVFISSTLGELAPERDAVEAAVRTLRLTPVRFELGARAHGPADVYRSYLEQSDVFVGIYWESYGWVGPGARMSGIEDELERSRGRPQLIYVKEPAPERDAELERLLGHVRSDALVSYRTFGAPGELSELVLDDLAVLLTERFHGRAESRALPEGVVTFVFVDMEGSTRIAQELPDVYPDIVAAFQSALARIVESCGGVVIDTEGDGAFCVFPVVDQATRAAVAFQRELDETGWPDDAIVRARVGIHTGEARRTASNYVGLEVHRAARIGAAANGGQILVSRTSAKLLGQQLLEGWHFADLGSFALKGLDRAEELLQLNAPGLMEEQQAPRARGTRSVHLPTHLTGILGRESEIAAAAELMERHDVRLVTLTGPGGIGKTRLGVASATRAADAYPDGVYFVALADTRSTDQVVAAIASALGIRSEGSRALLSTIEDRLSSGRALLVLDNFEQIIDARTVVAQLLESCPGLDLFVTSRTPLRLRGETEFSVPPLPESDAVRLFVERATGTRPSWSPTEADSAAILEICRRLDGLPLAIELAAARLRVLDPPSLLERLAGKLDVVGGSVPDLPERQRTLTATIEWSYDLLDEAERTLLARLAVFSGGWTVEAAEAVCGGDEVPDVLSSLERLCEHSLLVREFGAVGNPRMRMLETIREFAAERMAERDESEPLCARHAEYFAGLVVELRSRGTGDAAPEALALLDDDWDDLLSCMDWLFHRGRRAELVQLLSGTWRYVWLRDRVHDTLHWLTGLYEARDALEPPLRGELCRMYGAINYQLGHFDAARAAIDEAVALLGEHGPLDREAWARTLRAGLLPYYDPDLSEPLEEMTRAVALFRQTDNLFGLGTSLALIGTIRTFSGDPVAGALELDEGVATAERLGLPELVAANRTLRALGHLASDEIEEARRCLDASASATIYLEGTAYRLEGFAAVLLATGDPVGAATALGAAEGLRERTGIHPWPIMRVVFGERLAGLAAAGPEVEAARFAGRQLGPADALELVRSRQAPRSAATSTAALTP
jgi:predicted ATPase/class 3 adenylate cyclase